MCVRRTYGRNPLTTGSFARLNPRSNESIDVSGPGGRAGSLAYVRRPCMLETWQALMRVLNSFDPYV